MKAFIIRQTLLAGVGLLASAAMAAGSSVKNQWIMPDIPVDFDKELYQESPASYGDHLAVQLGKYLYPADQVSLVLTAAETHENGRSAYKFQQKIGEANVIRGDIVLRTDEVGNIYYFRGPILPTNASLGKYIPPPSKAFVNQVVACNESIENSSLLEFVESNFFYCEETDQIVPAHIYHADAMFITTLDSQKLIVNSATGEILEKSPILFPALDRDIYDCNDSSTLPATPTRSEGDGEVTGNPEVNSAYTSSGLVYNYYLNNFSRYSFDNYDSTISVYVEWTTVNNAYWDGINDHILLGGGSDNFHNAFDVMAHEFSHGVANEEALIYGEYYNHWTALHESFADCMGSSFDFYRLDIPEEELENDDLDIIWQLGEDLTSGSTRDLRDPVFDDATDIRDEEEYDDYPWIPYWNSGVPSLAFYLASKGVAHPNGVTEIVVPSCGIASTAENLYNSLRYYYDSTETMEEAALDQTNCAHNESYSLGCSISAAWYAVGYEDVFWPSTDPDDEWKMTYMGWAYFGDSDTYGNELWLEGNEYYYDAYDSDDGGIIIWDRNPDSYYWTSGEIFPVYWDYTTSNWDTFSGSYE